MFDHRKRKEKKIIHAYLYVHYDLISIHHNDDDDDDQ